MHSNHTDHETVMVNLREIERRVDDVEKALRSLGAEIRTRQLVIVDEDDHPRIVGEVFADTAELRLELPSVDAQHGPEVVLFAVTSSHPGPLDLGPAVGLQIRAEGRAVVELDARPEERGRWQPHFHASGG